MVKRYTVTGDYSYPCIEEDDGCMVYYGDYAALAERCERLEATLDALRVEVAYYKENFMSCMATLDAINNAITEADEEGRGFVPVHQLTVAFSKESP